MGASMTAMAEWEALLWSLDRDPDPQRLGPLADALEEAGHAAQAEGLRAILAAGLWPGSRKDWRGGEGPRPRNAPAPVGVPDGLWEWQRWQEWPGSTHARTPGHLDTRDFDMLSQFWKRRHLSSAATSVSYARLSEALLDLAEYLASPMGKSKPQYAPGFIGRSACSTEGVDSHGREVTVPQGSWWRVTEVYEDPDPDDRRYQVVLLRMRQDRRGWHGRDDRRGISYDGAWDGFLEDGGLSPLERTAVLAACR